MNYQRYEDEESIEKEYEPLSKKEVEALFSKKQLTPKVSSPWQIVKFQCYLTFGFTIAGCIYSLIFGIKDVVFSVILGGILGVIPSTMFIIRVRFKKFGLGLSARSFVSSLVYAEVIKITLTFTIIFLVVRLYPGLNWLCFLGMYLITLQSYWLIGFVKIKD